MPKVIVLGGGLAGLVCAKVLAAQKVADVELWEASDRFGGKAGSTQHNGRWVDHGFHIFPAWYQNTNALLDELGITLWPGQDFYEVYERHAQGKQAGDSRGSRIKFRTLSRTMVATLDMISRPDWYLNDLSVEGFLRGRLYAGRNSGERLREISRKALGSPAYLTSSLSMQSNLHWWMPVFKKPNWNALRGSLQETFIEPLVAATRAAGAELHLNKKLVSIELRNERIVPLAEGDAPGSGDETAIVVSALPVEVIKAVAQRSPHAFQQLIDLDVKLQEIQYLEATPLAALDLHFTRRLENLPPGHFILRSSRYELTGLDITTVWDSYGPNHPTVVQFCAGDTTEIRALPDAAFTESLIEEVRRYFPFDLADIDREHTVATKHLDAPLFMNVVGSNERRVEPNGTGIINLYMIGDHTATPVDLACMEGAVYSALLAAQAICGELHIEGPEPKTLRGLPKPFIFFLKGARYPLGWAALPLRLTEPYYRRRAAQEKQQRAPLRGAAPNWAEEMRGAPPDGGTAASSGAVAPPGG